MTQNGDRHRTSKDIIVFLSAFTELLEGQLNAVRGTMSETVETVMDGINRISEATETKKRQAEEILVKTYVEPDAETSAIVSSLQESVDDVFEAVSSRMREDAEAGKLGTTAAASPTKTGNLQAQILDNQLRRFGGKFSKHMEALGTLDGELRDLLFTMMGALSSDDVIAQRLEHVCLAIQALKVGLSYVLADFEKRFNSDDVARLRGDLLNYTFNKYTMEDEKKLFAALFPAEHAHLRKKAS